MADLTLVPFDARVDGQKGIIVISSNGSNITIPLGSSYKAKEAIAFTSSLFEVDVLPASLGFTPFKVLCNTDGTFALSNDSGKVEFTKMTFETLIKLIDMATTKAADELKLKGGARAGVGGIQVPEPSF